MTYIIHIVTWNITDRFAFSSKLHSIPDIFIFSQKHYNLEQKFSCLCLIFDSDIETHSSSKFKIAKCLIRNENDLYMPFTQYTNTTIRNI